MANLSDLPYDMLARVAKRLEMLEDFTWYRSVSKSLRAATKDEYFEGLRLRRGTPYLMLPGRDGDDDTLEFYSLVEGESVVASVKVAKFKNKKCLESLGWLMASEEDGSKSLLDPFSGTEIAFPHQYTFPGYEHIQMDELVFFEKMLLSASPSETSDFVLMVICGGLGHLSFWRLGNKSWNRIEDRPGWFCDVVYHGGGQFYAFNNPGAVWVFNLARNDNQIQRRKVAHFIPGDASPASFIYGGLGDVLVGSNRKYLVKTVDDSLLNLTRASPIEGEDNLSNIITQFQVYEVDAMTSRWEKLHSLGRMAVFLGHNSAITVDDSRFPGTVIKGNHVLSDLPYDMLAKIAKRLEKLEDFTSFRSVSKSLRVAAKDEYFEGLRLRQGTPYLMLPVRDGSDDTREFYSLVEGESVVASVKVAKLRNKKCLESLGWLLASEKDGSMSLLDPFSGTEIPLPHQATFPGYDIVGMDELVFFQKMVLSARPSETSDFVLMVIGGGFGHLGFWRLGDKTWNRIEDRPGRFRDVVYHGGGQFYAFNNSGAVWVLNLSGNDNQVERRIVTLFKPKDFIPAFKLDLRNVLVDKKRIYLVKTVDDSLLIITRACPKPDDEDFYYVTSQFQVYEVDVVKGTWEEIHSLGRMAVFLGHNSTIAVDASRFPGTVIKANHIYFTDDNWEAYYYFDGPKEGGGIDSGVYNLETGTVEAIYPGEVLCSRVSSPTWITPCF